MTLWASDANEIRTLLRLGVARARVDGWQPSTRSQEVIAALDWLADNRGVVVDETATAAPPDRRIGTAEAGALLNLSGRQIRNMAKSGLLGARRVAGAWSLSCDEVDAEIEARDFAA